MRKILYVLGKLLMGGYSAPQHEPGTDPNCPFCREMKSRKEAE